MSNLYETLQQWLNTTPMDSYNQCLEDYRWTTILFTAAAILGVSTMAAKTYERIYESPRRP